MIAPSLNCRLTSSTTTPAVRPTARIAIAENMKATEPPMRSPMNTSGSATLIDVATLRKTSDPESPRSSSEAMVSTKGGEQGHGRDHRRTDGKALRHCLRGVADRIEADHDDARLTVELTRHLGDPAALSATGPNVSSDTTTPWWRACPSR